MPSLIESSVTPGAFATSSGSSVVLLPLSPVVDLPEPASAPVSSPDVHPTRTSSTTAASAAYLRMEDPLVGVLMIALTSMGR